MWSVYTTECLLHVCENTTFCARNWLRSSGWQCHVVILSKANAVRDAANTIKDLMYCINLHFVPSFACSSLLDSVDVRLFDIVDLKGKVF